MYCQFCGTEATHELNYCKRCGGILNPLTNISTPDTRPVVSGRVAFAIGATTFATVIFGLLIIFQSLYELARAGLNPVALSWIALFGAVTLFGSLALFIWLWSRVLGVSATRTTATTTPQLKKPSFTNELGASKVMPSLPDPIPSSVTEHTTRTFSPSYKEPRTP